MSKLSGVQGLKCLFFLWQFVPNYVYCKVYCDFLSDLPQDGLSILGHCSFLLRRSARLQGSACIDK